MEFSLGPIVEGQVVHLSLDGVEDAQRHWRAPVADEVTAAVRAQVAIMMR